MGTYRVLDGEILDINEWDDGPMWAWANDRKYELDDDLVERHEAAWRAMHAIEREIYDVMETQRPRG